MWGCVINTYLKVHYEGLFYWDKNELMESWYKKKIEKESSKFTFQWKQSSKVKNICS